MGQIYLFRSILNKLFRKFLKRFESYQRAPAIFWKSPPAGPIEATGLNKRIPAQLLAEIRNGITYCVTASVHNRQNKKPRILSTSSMIKPQDRSRTLESDCLSLNYQHCSFCLFVSKDPAKYVSRQTNFKSLAANRCCSWIRNNDTCMGRWRGLFQRCFHLQFSLYRNGKRNERTALFLVDSLRWLLNCAIRKDCHCYCEAVPAILVLWELINPIVWTP